MLNALATVGIIAGAIVVWLLAAHVCHSLLGKKG